MSAQDLDSLFNLPLSQQALDELQDLEDMLMYQSFDEQDKDCWTYQWGNGTYSSSRFYKMVFQNMPAHPIFTWMWKSKCTPRVKFFAWLILVDRLNTKTMLKRIHLFNEENAHCVTCDAGIEEDIDHLFFSCEFAKSCWEKIGFHWNMNLSLYPRVAHARQQHNLPFFMEALIIAGWEIWKICNNKVFRNGPVQVSIWFRNFKRQCLLQSLRFSDDLRSSFCVWLDAFS